MNDEKVRYCEIAKRIEGMTHTDAEKAQHVYIYIYYIMRES